MKAGDPSEWQPKRTAAKGPHMSDRYIADVLIVHKNRQRGNSINKIVCYARRLG